MENFLYYDVEEILSGISDENSPITRILNSINEGIYITDRRRKILFWNKGAEIITGYTRQQVIGKHCHHNILDHLDCNGHHLCRAACPLVNAIKTGESITEKVYLKDVDGIRIPKRAQVCPLKDKDGKAVAALEIFHNITIEENHRKLAEKFNKMASKYMSRVTQKSIQESLQNNTEITSNHQERTVLFMDIVGFTAFSESHTPLEATDMLNDIFGICEVITTEYHGDIDKFIGDCIMAVFIDPNDAVLAGGKIIEAMKMLNTIKKIENQSEIKTRIGINTGMVMEGEIGTITRKDLTVIGDTVNTVSRIESNTVPGCMCISESTFQQLKHQEQFKKHKDVMVKNKKDPVPIYIYTVSNEDPYETLPKELNELIDFEESEENID